MKKRRLLEVLMHQWPVKALSLAAAVMLFLFNRMSLLQERYLAVDFTILCSGDFVPATSHEKAVRVRLKGEPGRIATVQAQDLRAFVDLRDEDAEGAYTAAVQLEWLGGGAGANGPMELSVEPRELLLRIERKLVKLVPVTPRFSGRLEPGYDFVSTLVPDRVEIEGPRSAVERISEVRTESIELSGRTADFSLRARLRPDTELVAVRGAAEATFSARVEKVDSLKTLPAVAIELRGLAPGLELASPPGPGSIRLQGSVQAIRDFQPAGALLYVDCADVTKAGSYRLPVRTAAPADFVVIDFSPEELVLDFSETIPPGRPPE